MRTTRFRSNKSRTYKRYRPRNKMARKYKRFTSNKSNLYKNTKISTGVANKSILRFQYEDVYGITPAGQREFKLNSLYDPDSSGVGHQPYGLDQWAAFYNKYRVFAVKMEVTAANSDPSAAVIIALTASPTQQSLFYVSRFQELPRVKTLVLSSEVGGTSSKRLKYKAYLPKIAGLTSAQYRADEDYEATFGADPADLIYGYFGVQALNSYSTSAATSCQVRIKITQYAEVYDRKFPDPS